MDGISTDQLEYTSFMEEAGNYLALIKEAGNYLALIKEAGNYLALIKTAAEAIDTLTKAAGSGDLARALVILEKIYKSAVTIVEGEAAAGTLSTTEMTTNLTEATNDHYKDCVIIWTSGVLQDQRSEISAYDGATKMLTFTAVTEAPTAEIYVCDRV